MLESVGLSTKASAAQHHQLNVLGSLWLCHGHPHESQGVTHLIWNTFQHDICPHNMDYGAIHTEHEFDAWQVLHPWPDVVRHLVFLGNWIVGVQLNPTEGAPIFTKAIELH